MDEVLTAIAEEITGSAYAEALSEELEQESIRYSRSLPEEREARTR